jgi:hypothetical protein
MVASVLKKKKKESIHPISYFKRKWFYLNPVGHIGYGGGVARSQAIDAVIAKRVISNSIVYVFTIYFCVLPSIYI